MSSEKITPINFHSGRQRPVRFTIAAINTVTLVGSILFVSWILGKIIGALHALVFSLVLTGAPDPNSKDFSMLEDPPRKVELPSLLQESDRPPDSGALYSLNHNDLREKAPQLTGHIYPASQKQTE